MAQHHLHSKESRNYPLVEVLALSEADTERLLALLRWNSDTEQGCPSCGVFRSHYRRPEPRGGWRCAACEYEFTVTAGTLWDKHKLPLRLLVAIVHTFESGANGQALLHTSRLLGLTPKTVQVHHGKLREALLRSFDTTPLKGIVHMDGGYFCGKPRKSNRRVKVSSEELAVRFGRKKPVDSERPWESAGMTRLNWFKRLNKRAVISVCESAGANQGSRRTMAFVCRSENASDIRAIARAFIDRDAMVMTDENSAYSVLDGEFDHYAVRHADEFCTAEGVSDNMSEMFNSRVRRAEYGIFHGYRVKYLQDQMCEAAWRDTHKRMSQRDRVELLLRLVLGCPVSRWWRGYWQGRHRKGELGLFDFLDVVRQRRGPSRLH